MKKTFLSLVMLGTASAENITQEGKLFIFYGPSGVGKTTLIKHAAQQFSLAQVVTHTTRAPRPGEQDGIDYHFISPEQFAEKKNNDFFIHTTELLTASYGLRRSIVDDLKQGKNFVVSLDRAGAEELSQLMERTVLLWVYAPLEDLVARMHKRSGDTPEQIAKRYALAEKEIQEEPARGLYHYCIMNADLELAHAHVAQAIRSELTNVYI